MKLFPGRFCAALVIATFATTAWADNAFIVTNAADSGAGSLRQAMLNANAAGGGDITFSNIAGKIFLASALPQITANVNISGPGETSLILSGSNKCTIFSIHSGTTNTFQNFSIADAFAQGIGGGIPSDPTTNYPGCAISNAGCLTVMNCTISNCVNHAGASLMFGAVVRNYGTLAMQQCKFVNSGVGTDGSPTYGGCIYNAGAGYLTLNGCVLTNCTVYAGAGLDNDGTPMLTNCLLLSLEDTDDDANGGAIASFGSLTLLSCVVSNCGGSYLGAAIYGANIVMSNTVITCNRGVQEGGGGMENFGDTTMVDCTVSGNQVLYNGIGGGVYNLGSSG